VMCESTCIGKKIVHRMQGDQTQRSGAGHLCEESKA
jgi:hypothetical protein